MAFTGQGRAFSYFQIINGMLSRPGAFFSKNLSDHNVKKPVLFLLISVVFNVAASLTVIKGNMFVLAGILVLNATVMPIVAAVVSVAVLRIITGSNISLVRIFSIYAYAWGTTLYASWIPMMFWITEPWKWFLVTKGFTKGCDITYMQAITASVITIGLIIMGFYFLMDLTS